MERCVAFSKSFAFLELHLTVVCLQVNILPPVERSTAEAILAGKDIPDPPKPEDETDTEVTAELAFTV